MSSHALKLGLAALIFASGGSAAQAKAVAPCARSSALDAPASRSVLDTCVAAAGSGYRDQLVLSLILIGCAAGIGGQAARRRGVKMVFS